MDTASDQREWLQGAVERLLREACAAQVRVLAADGAPVAQAVAAVPGGPSPDAVESAWLGPFQHALWESPDGAIHLRRLPEGRLLVVAFDQRSSPGLVRVRSLELASMWERAFGSGG